MQQRDECGVRSWAQSRRGPKSLAVSFLRSGKLEGMINNESSSLYACSCKRLTEVITLCSLPLRKARWAL